MIITTTNSIEGKRIIDYKGVISGEVIVGINAFKDLFASVRNVIGGRSKSYEEELVKARTAAMKELEERAEQLGANAIVGVDIDYQALGADNGMMMVIATGTAVYCQ
ncbi:MAG: heavy metal-binding domain-containing protein [Bacteroidales bacterium]|nr:heavy metal-binding domain-containing protein [Bacteroidales bacterium]